MQTFFGPYAEGSFTERNSIGFFVRSATTVRHSPNKIMVLCRPTFPESHGAIPGAARFFERITVLKSPLIECNVLQLGNTSQFQMNSRLHLG